MGRTEVLTCDICNRVIDPAVDKVAKFHTGQKEWVLSNNCKDDVDFAAKAIVARDAMKAEVATTFQQLRAQLGI